MALALDISVSLSLPRDHLTVPVVRHICRSVLQEVGVAGASIADIELAVTEACTNVVEHSGAEDEYEVQIVISEWDCVIRVRDTGAGFDPDELDAAGAEPSAESGRGVSLMRALVDNLSFTSEPGAGLVVRLRKELDFDEDALIRRASRAGSTG